MKFKKEILFRYKAPPLDLSFKSELEVKFDNYTWKLLTCSKNTAPPRSWAMFFVKFVLNKFTVETLYPYILPPLDLLAKFE